MINDLFCFSMESARSVNAVVCLCFTLLMRVSAVDASCALRWEAFRVSTSFCSWALRSFAAACACLYLMEKEGGAHRFRWGGGERRVDWTAASISAAKIGEGNQAPDPNAQREAVRCTYLALSFRFSKSVSFAAFSASDNFRVISRALLSDASLSAFAPADADSCCCFIASAAASLPPIAYARLGGEYRHVSASVGANVGARRGATTGNNGLVGGVHMVRSAVGRVVQRGVAQSCAWPYRRQRTPELVRLPLQLLDAHTPRGGGRLRHLLAVQLVDQLSVLQLERQYPRLSLLLELQRIEFVLLQLRGQRMKPGRQGG